MPIWRTVSGERRGRTLAGFGGCAQADTGERTTRCSPGRAEPAQAAAAHGRRPGLDDPALAARGVLCMGQRRAAVAGARPRRVGHGHRDRVHRQRRQPALRGDVHRRRWGLHQRHVRLLGVDDEQRAEGPAPGPDGRPPGRQRVHRLGSNLLHLRWAIGLSLVLLCGVGIVWGTGALRLADRASRWKATLTALGPRCCSPWASSPPQPSSPPCRSSPRPARLVSAPPSPRLVSASRRGARPCRPRAAAGRTRRPPP